MQCRVARAFRRLGTRTVREQPTHGLHVARSGAVHERREAELRHGIDRRAARAESVHHGGVALARSRVQRGERRLAFRVGGGAVRTQHLSGREVPVVRGDDEYGVPVGAETVD